MPIQSVASLFSGCEGHMKTARSSSISSSSLPSKRKSVRFQNYCGIGVDAQIVLQFHEMRNENPHIFFHRWVNKLWYGVMGWKQIWRKSFAGFRNMVDLYVDGTKVDLPEDCEGIVFCNVLSYGGGSKLWIEEVGLLDQTYLPGKILYERIILKTLGVQLSKEGIAGCG